MVTRWFGKHCWDSLVSLPLPDKLVSLPLPDKLEHSIISSWPLLVSLVSGLASDLLGLVYALHMDFTSWSFSCYSGMVGFTLYANHLPNLSPAYPLSGGTGSLNSRNIFSLASIQKYFSDMLAGCLEFERITGSLFIRCHDDSSKQHEVSRRLGHWLPTIIGVTSGSQIT